MFLLSCPLVSRGSLCRAEEGLQTKRTPFGIFSRDEIEAHVPIGLMDCCFDLFWWWLQYLSSFLPSVSRALVGSLREAQGLALSPRGGFHSYPSTLHAWQGRAGVWLQSWRQHAAKPTCQGKEREEMLRKGVLHCTDMGNLPVGEQQ